jgi:hypothetical protein
MKQAGLLQLAHRFPVITAAFFSDALNESDWGQISGTIGRNTKVSGMLSSGKKQMRDGWIIVIMDDGYFDRYASVLSSSRA